MADTGPNALQLHPKITVTRLNKTALLVAGGMGAMALGAILYSFQSPPPRSVAPAEAQPVSAGTSEPWYARASDALPTFVEPKLEPEPEPVALPLPPKLPAAPADPKIMDAALRSDLTLPGFSRTRLSMPSTPGTTTAAAAHGYPDLDEPDLNRQADKQRWLEAAVDSGRNDVLPSMVKEPLSSYEVKAGGLIPAVMITGINSDLPGQITAQVRENVYDTVTGRHLLIPQGSRLIGVYDSAVTYGQRRVLIAWNRLIFPDGRSLDLRGQPGADSAGMAGFRDQVNNHYARTFGGAILLSIIGAGAQLSQPQESARDGAPSATQIMAASMGQQFGQVSSELIRRNMRIQPTLDIRPGYRFNVVITQDLIFPHAYQVESPARE